MKSQCTQLKTFAHMIDLLVDIIGVLRLAFLLAHDAADYTVNDVCQDIRHTAELCKKMAKQKFFMICYDHRFSQFSWNQMVSRN